MEETSDQLSQVELLAEEYLDRQQRGEKPTIREYCEKFPELADEIREVFEAVAMVEELKPDSNDATGTFGNGVEVDGKRPDRVGDYRILREVGRGGMGVVYEAEQESLRRRVALKVMPKNLAGDEKALIRFQREARAAARMHHTNIVPVFEVGEDDVHVFYAMQLIQGQGLDLVVDDLRRLRTEQLKLREENSITGRARSADDPNRHSLAASLVTGRFHQDNLIEQVEHEQSAKNSGRSFEDEAYAETVLQDSGSTQSAVLPGQSELSTAESDRNSYFRSVAEIGLQTSRALSYAHARGIIHRDIKPSNLILDSAGVVWVTDFGLAKTGDEGMTHTGDILGTIRYMSPERFQGQCDVRADLYSLGLTMYEMLVLKPAYASPDRLRLIEMVTKTEPDLPRSLDPKIPRDLETIVLKCIDKDVRRRYQSADELAEDLQRFVDDEPIHARRISLAERYVRWARRNKLIASLGAVITLLLVYVVVSQRITNKELKYSADLNEQLRIDAERNAGIAEKNEKEAERQKRKAERNEEDLHIQNYFSIIHQVRLAWEDGSITQARHLLQSLMPWPKDEDDDDPDDDFMHEDLRGWAWHYWWRAGHLETNAVTAGPPVGQAVVDPQGGSWAAVSVIHHEIRIYELPSLQEKHKIDNVKWDPFCSLHVVSADGEKFVTVSDSPDSQNDIIKIWNTSDWSEDRDASFELPGVTNISLSSQGILAVLYESESGNETKWVSFWDLASRTQIGQPHPVGKECRRVMFSPNGNQLLLHMTQNSPEGFAHRRHDQLHIWDDWRNPQPSNTRFIKTKDHVFCINWFQHGDQTSIVTGTAHGTVRRWNGDSLDEKMSFSASGVVTGLSATPDGGRIAATTGRTNAVFVWESETGKELTRIQGHSSHVTRAAFFNQGQSILSPSADGTVKTWKISESQPFRRMSRPAFEFGSKTAEVVFGNHARSLWTYGWTGRPQRWDPHSGARLSEFDPGSQDSIIGYSDDGSYLVVFTPEGDSGTFEIYDLTSGEPKPVGTELVIPDERIRHPKRLVISDDGGTITLTMNRDEKASSTELDPDVLVLKLESDLSSIKWHHIIENKGLEFWQISYAHLALSGDGKVLAIPRRDYTELRDVSHADDVDKTGSKVKPNWNDPIFDVAITSDGKRLAQSYWSGAIGIYDVETGREEYLFHGHSGVVNGIDFSPDDKLLASGGDDGTVRLWNLDSKYPGLILTLAAHDTPVRRVSCSMDGKMIASVSLDGEVRVWERWLPDELMTHMISLESLLDEHRQRRDWPSAIDDLTAMIALSPEDPELYRQRGNFYLPNEQFDEARKDFLEAISHGIADQFNPGFGVWRPFEAGAITMNRKWKRTITLPDSDADWKSPDFDDTLWDEGGPRFDDPVGKRRWPENKIWLRKEITLNSDSSRPMAFLMFVDDEVTVYVNGKLAANAKWLDSNYQVVGSSVELKPGKNVLAVYCQNNNREGGVHVIPGQFVDSDAIESRLMLVSNLPKSPDHLKKLTRVLAGAGRWHSDAAAFARFVEAKIRSGEWERSAHWSSDYSRFLQALAEQEEFFPKLLQVIPQTDKDNLWLERGRVLARQKQWKEANDAYNHYHPSTNDPTKTEYGEVWFEMACVKLLVPEEEYRGWVREFLQHAKKDPVGDLPTYLARTLGLADQEKVDADRAVEWGQRGVDAHRAPWKLHALGLAQLRAGDLEAAEANFLESVPDWDQYQNQLGRALVDLRRGEVDSAKKRLKEVNDYCESKIREGNGTADVLAIDWLEIQVLLREVQSELPK